MLNTDLKHFFLILSLSTNIIFFDFYKYVNYYYFKLFNEVFYQSASEAFFLLLPLYFLQLESPLLM